MNRFPRLPGTDGRTGATPLCDDSVTLGGLRCAVCGQAIATVSPRGAIGRRRYCSAACRQTAWRRRHPVPLPPLPPVPARTAPPTTIYECPACGARLLGEQRCAACGVFCRRIGPGGPCPHCDEPVALADLLPPRATP